MPRGTTVEEIGLPENTIVRIDRDPAPGARGYIATLPDGTVLDKDVVPNWSMRAAFKEDNALQLVRTNAGEESEGSQWRQVSMHEYDVARNIATHGEPEDEEVYVTGTRTTNMTNTAIRETVKRALEIKPKSLKISEIWWKFAVRTVLRGDNILAVGPSGCGKTLLANALAHSLSRTDRFYYVNLGSTQDPRSTLIGNTHYDPDKGTFVSLSYFAQAIQKENAIILLDEASRAHPEAHNILMTVLDQKQRYLRVDEKADAETISVAPGVSFILTANVGTEYTATRTMDRALLDRCVMIEMHPMSREDEHTNLREKFPEVKDAALKAIAFVAGDTREEIMSDDPRIDTIISTRMAERWASLIQDGFSFLDAAEVCVYPFFSDAGGAEAPRAHIKQVIQKYTPDDEAINKSKQDPSGANDAQVPW